MFETFLLIKHFQQTLSQLHVIRPFCPSFNAMYLSRAILFVSLVASTIAAPSRKRADLLQVQAYAQFQISDGLAGNALEEVAKKFPVRSSKPTASLVARPYADIMLG